MTDPPRLLDDSDNPLIVEMLAAAREQAPRRRAIHSTLLAVGTAASIAGTHTTAAAGSVAAASLVKLAAQWTVLSAVVVSAGVASVETGVFTSAEDTAPQPLSAPAAMHPAPSRAALDAARPQDPQNNPAEAPTSQVLPDAPKAQLQMRAPSATEAAQREQLSREIAELDRARRALAQGNAAQALTLSSRYLEQFPEGRMEQEARYLSMRAAQQVGDVARAESDATRLLQLSPSGPHAKAAHEMLEALPEP